MHVYIYKSHIYLGYTMATTHLLTDPVLHQLPQALLHASGLLWLGAGRSNLSLASRSTLLPAGAIFKDRFKAVMFRGMVKSDEHQHFERYGALLVALLSS